MIAEAMIYPVSEITLDVIDFFNKESTINLIIAIFSATVITFFAKLLEKPIKKQKVTHLDQFNKNQL